MIVLRKAQAGLLLSAALFLGSTHLQAGILASATYTDTLISPGTYQYDLTLTNTGTTTIGTFWFGWVPGAGFLSATPTSIVNPAGWSDVVTNSNMAIQWTTTTSLLMPGDSVSGFEFDSTETPTQFLGTVPSGLGAGDPVTTGFVYIDAPLADPGFQLVATPAAIGTPEPSTFALAFMAIAAGVAALQLRRARRRAHPSPLARPALGSW